MHPTALCRFRSTVVGVDATVRLTAVAKVLTVAGKDCGTVLAVIRDVRWPAVAGSGTSRHRSKEEMPMISKESVQEALDLIRPALQADGGDVELVDVTDDGVVKVAARGRLPGLPDVAADARQRRRARAQGADP